jgi:phosphoribosylanthranilate isomerase
VTRIKFCGMTSPGDVALAVEAGADAIGAIVSTSPRRVAASALENILAAVPPFVTAVVVSANESDVDLEALASRGVLLQFSGTESPASCERLAGGRAYLKAFHVRAEDGAAAFDGGTLDAYPNAVALFDSSALGRFGGTGRRFDWTIARAVGGTRRLVISGGLTPENVAECVATIRPYAVDVRSGIETSGRKDPEKMRAFVRAVREADARTVPVPATPNV